MSRWPDIDWPAFGASVDDALRYLSGAGLSARELDYHGVSRGALGRARRGVRTSAANYCAICALFGWDPANFLVNSPAPVPDHARASLPDVSWQTFTEPASEPRLAKGR